MLENTEGQRASNRDAWLSLSTWNDTCGYRMRSWKRLECLPSFLFIKVKEKSEKDGLKLNIQKTEVMASSSITSWQIDGETMENDHLYNLEILLVPLARKSPLYPDI